MNPRERWEEIEKSILSPRAQKSAYTRGRLREEEKDPLRTEYQRDRDRILHSKAFRRLKHKTQVLFAPQGDHFRTRMTHTLEVCQIARTIGRCLQLNEDLIEAIALGHDLGHTPFGHAGETALDEILKKYGKNGFRHYEQSLRVVDVLENQGKGLNLTYEVRDGILKHSKGVRDLQEKTDLPLTLEGQVVCLADRIAYVNHDLDDAIRAGFSFPSCPHFIQKHIQKSYSERIAFFVRDVVESSQESDHITISPEGAETLDGLKDWLFETVYLSENQRREAVKVARMLSSLFAYYLENDVPLSSTKQIEAPEDKIITVVDYIAGMTDQYAFYCFQNIFQPKPWTF
ncbi:MAG: deoxyguanosinetriphosphate triphosphohydrolase [bacterium JZ-2024 1]